MKYWYRKYRGHFTLIGTCHFEMLFYVPYDASIINQDTLNKAIKNYLDKFPRILQNHSPTDLGVFEEQDMARLEYGFRKNIVS